MRVIDFDQIAEWNAWFTDAIVEIAPLGFLEELARGNPKYMEDSREVVTSRIGKDRLTEHLMSSLAEYRVRVYHGTRLDPDQLENIRQIGLRPLRLMDRKPTIVRIASRHPNWSEVEQKLDHILQQFGPGGRAGHREDDSVHVCFSRSGLIHGCNHYLTHGAEVDNHVFDALFGDTGRDYLPAQRQPALISFEPNFGEAVRSANPWGVSRGELPSLVNLLLCSWAYRQSHPEFETGSLEDCTAARFERPIPAAEITGIEVLDDTALEPRKATV